MKRIKTYWWFWIWVPATYSLGFYHENIFEFFNISFHDTWNAKSFIFFSLFSTFFLFLSGFAYLFKRLSFSKKLSRIQLIATLLGIEIIYLTLIVVFQSENVGSIYHYPKYNFILYLHSLHILIDLGFILIIVGFICYLTNIGLAIFNKTKN